MTVFTTLPSSEAKDNDTNKSTEVGDGFKPPPKKPSIAWGETKTAKTKFPASVAPWLNLEEKPYRATAFRTLCILNAVCLVILLGLLAVLMASRYQQNRHHRRRWTCGTSYLSNARRYNQPRRLHEQVDIDEDEGWETIKVLGEREDGAPQTWFVHDFVNELTAVVDEARDICFVKRLDRVRVLPPNEAMAALDDRKSRFYHGRSRVIRETYKVTKMSTHIDSPIIRPFCEGKTTYMVVKVFPEHQGDSSEENEIMNTHRISVHKMELKRRQALKRQLIDDHKEQVLGAPERKFDGRFSQQRWKRSVEVENEEKKKEKENTCETYSGQHEEGAILEMNICI